MASASAAVAASTRVDRLTHEERNSLLRQLHRDNAWLLGCLADSNAAFEQLHDRLEAELKVAAPVPTGRQGLQPLALLTVSKQADMLIKHPCALSPCCNGLGCSFAMSLLMLYCCPCLRTSVIAVMLVLLRSNREVTALELFDSCRDMQGLAAWRAGKASALHDCMVFLNVIGHVVRHRCFLLSNKPAFVAHCSSPCVTRHTDVFKPSNSCKT